MALVRARITQFRQKAQLIAAAVPGLDAAIIHLGVVAPEGEEDDEDLFKLIRAKTPIAWSTSTGHATVTFDSNHSWKVDDVVTVSIAALAFNYAVTITAVTDNSITFINPEPGADMPIAFTEGDLVFSIRLVIKAAIPRNYDVGTHRGDTTFDILLYFGIEYASQTFIAIEDLATQLRDALALSSNWSGLNSGPEEVTMEEPRLMRRDNPVPGFYKFTLMFKGN